MNSIQGKCDNFKKCSLAKKDDVIEITDGNLFCPECGEAMQPIKKAKKFVANRFVIIVIVGLLLALLIFVFVGLLKKESTPENEISSNSIGDGNDKSIPSQISGLKCTDDTVIVDARIYTIGKDMDTFLKKYKQKYAQSLALNIVDGEMEVDIDPGICLQKNEVSVLQFKQFLDSNTNQLDRNRINILKNTISSRADEYPMENVSKDEAELYAQWLSVKNNKVIWILPDLGHWLAAVSIYGEQSPVTNTLDGQPALIKAVSDPGPTNLIGNLREWSTETCPGGRFQLLGRNYLSGNEIDNAYCQYPETGSPGIGFRLIYLLQE